MSKWLIQTYRAAIILPLYVTVFAFAAIVFLAVIFGGWFGIPILAVIAFHELPEVWNVLVAVLLIIMWPVMARFSLICWDLLP